MRYSRPKLRNESPSPIGMYLIGSKKSVRLLGSFKKLQFSNCGRGISAGRSGSGGGPGEVGSGVCASAAGITNRKSRPARIAVFATHPNFDFPMEDVIINFIIINGFPSEEC